MSGADAMIIVTSFFMVGVMVGIAVVYALSARKADRAHSHRPEEARDARRRGNSGLPV